MDTCLTREKLSLIQKQLKVESVILGYKEGKSLLIVSAIGKGENILNYKIITPITSVENATFEKDVPLIIRDIINHKDFDSSSLISKTILPRNFLGYKLNNELAVFVYNKNTPFTSTDTSYIDSVLLHIIKMPDFFSLIKEIKDISIGKDIWGYINNSNTPILKIQKMKYIVSTNTAGLPCIQEGTPPILCKDTLQCRKSDGTPLCKECFLSDIALSKSNKIIKNVKIGIGDNLFDIEVIPSEAVPGDFLFIIHKKEENAAQMEDDVLITNIAHELKTPLAAILGSVQIMRSNISMKYSNDPVIGKFMDMVEKSAERLDNVLSSILNFQKSSETGGLKKEEFNAWQEIKNILTAFSPKLKEKNMRVKLKKSIKAGTDPILNCDIYAFRQIFMQIIDNAIKFSMNNSYIEVIYPGMKLYSGKWFYVFEVKDYGPGIDEEIMPHIFDKFARTDQSVHTLTGTGIGLAVVKELIDTMGGEIEIDTKKDEGTTVRILLPSTE